MIRPMPTSKATNNSGYSLIELIVVVIIIGIIAGVAVRSLRGANDVGKVELTKQRLDKIANAISGDPNLVSGGNRTSYGYVGDVGSLPPNLDALVTNPGGYSTWRGPYVVDELTPDGTNTRFKQDGWGQALTYSAGTTVSSSGGGTAIVRTIAPSSAALLLNHVGVAVTDLRHAVPGTIYRDSVKFLLDVPNGTGGTTTKIKYPASDGFAEYDSIPIGERQLRVVYIPNNDTVRRLVHIDPGTTAHVQVQLFRKVW